MIRFVLGGFHQAQVGALHDVLWRRRQTLKWTGRFASERVGRRGDFMRRLETGQRQDQRLSTVQDWCRGVDLRLRLQVEGFGPDVWPAAVGRFAADVQMLWQYWDLSGSHVEGPAPLRADPYLPLWTVAVLRAARRCQDPSDARLQVLCADLGMNAKGLWKWEAEATDPMLGRCLRFAEVLGLRVRLDAMELPAWRRWRDSIEPLSNGDA